MGYNNFKLFFEKNIKQYHPYSNNLLYSTISSFLLDPFLKDSYDFIPKKFIDLFENQIIDLEIYDSLLISLGYPEEFVISLSSGQKKIILNKFSNYYKYKSTLKHFREFCEVFNEGINLYELYITKKDEKYLFTPKNIYESNAEFFTTDLEYDKVYEGVPEFFISQDLLANYEKNKSIVFPIKSNLLYFVLSDGLDCSDITNLILSIVLYKFKDSKINIQIYDLTYLFDLSSLCQLWAYLLNLYSSNVNRNDFSSIITYYDINNSKNIYNLDNVDELISEYEKIYTIDDVYTFLNKYIKPNFSSYPSMQIISIEELRSILSYSVDIQIITKIEDILENSKNIEQELFSILSDILLSIRSWILNSSDEHLSEFGKYIIKTFYLPFSNIDNSIIYKLIKLFKPFHTNIYFDRYSNVVYKSKTNNLVIKDEFRLATDTPFYTACTIGDSFIIKIDGNEVIL